MLHSIATIVLLFCYYVEESSSMFWSCLIAIAKGFLSVNYFLCILSQLFVSQILKFRPNAKLWYVVECDIFNSMYQVRDRTYTAVCLPTGVYLISGHCPGPKLSNVSGHTFAPYQPPRVQGAVPRQKHCKNFSNLKLCKFCSRTTVWPSLLLDVEGERVLAKLPSLQR